MSLGPKDLVIYNKGGNVMAGGFKVDTIYGNNSPLKTLNSTPIGSGGTSQTGGSVGEIVADLAVPAGLLFMQQNYPSKYKFETISHENAISDTMHDKLLSMVSPNKRLHHSIKTRKKRVSKKTKTRKQK